MRRRAFFFLFSLTLLLLTGPPNFSVFLSILYYGQYFKVIELCVHKGSSKFRNSNKLNAPENKKKMKQNYKVC